MEIKKFLILPLILFCFFVRIGRGAESSEKIIIEVKNLPLEWKVVEFLGGKLERKVTKWLEECFMKTKTEMAPEIEISSYPSWSNNSSCYRAIMGEYHPILNRVWINSYFLNKEVFFHEFGHYIYHRVLTPEDQIEWVVLVKKTTLNLKITRKDEKEASEYFAKLFVCFLEEKNFGNFSPPIRKFFERVLK